MAEKGRKEVRKKSRERISRCVQHVRNIALPSNSKISCQYHLVNETAVSYLGTSTASIWFLHPSRYRVIIPTSTPRRQPDFAVTSTRLSIVRHRPTTNDDRSRADAYTYVRIEQRHVHVRTYVRMHACMYVGMCVCVCVCSASAGFPGVVRLVFFFSRRRSRNEKVLISWQ